MRGKKAKELRAMARNLTVGMPAVAYEDWSPAGYDEVNGMMRRVVPRVSARLKFVCTRAAYQMLKKK